MEGSDVEDSRSASEEIQAAEQYECDSSPVRSFDCKICNMGFTNISALGGHMNRHRRDKPKKQQEPAPLTYEENRYVSQKDSWESGMYSVPQPYYPMATDAQNHYMYYQESNSASWDMRAPYNQGMLYPSMPHEMNFGSGMHSEWDKMEVGDDGQHGEEEEEEEDQEIDLELRLGPSRLSEVPTAGETRVQCQRNMNSGELHQEIQVGITLEQTRGHKASVGNQACHLS